MVSRNTPPYWRLSGFYFFYFASLGILVPYWSLYLQWQGFSAQKIGELTAILLATRIIAPNLWGWLADYKNKRMGIIRGTSLASSLAFSTILFEQSYIWIATILFIFSFFWNASLPQFEVVTLQHLASRSHRYSGIRLWGSVGFIISVTSLGVLLEQFEAHIIPYAMLLSLTAIWLTSLTISDPSDQTNHTAHEPLSNILKQKEVIAFLIVCFLVQTGHSPYYTFYTIYLEQHDYSRIIIGQLWALGVIAEIFIFIFMHRWLAKFGIRNILLTSLLLGSLRWLIIGFYPDTLPLLIFAQILHAASFGTFHAASIAWVHHYFTGKNQGRGQALYSSIGFGAGGALGSLVSGYFWVYPGPAITFSLSAFITLSAFFIALRYLPQKNTM